MKRGLVALGAGVTFGAGLCISGMTQPGKVLSFLDFFGEWDPSLALVMAGAVAVSAAAFRLSARRRAPLLGDRFHVAPRVAPIDARLVVGSALFGVGWGLVGLCPGPAIVSLATGRPAAWLFFGAMVAGMALDRALSDLGKDAQRAPSSPMRTQ